jgi:hypothetical protein
LEVNQRTWWAGDFKIFKVALLLRHWKNLQVPYVFSTEALAFWKSIRERGGKGSVCNQYGSFSFLEVENTVWSGRRFQKLKVTCTTSSLEIN